jgi:FtsZ-interacting cell division protein YlmF
MPDEQLGDSWTVGQPNGLDRIDAFMTSAHSAFLEDLAAALDLDAGATEAAHSAKFTQLTTDLANALDLNAGLEAIVGGTVAPDAEPGDSLSLQPDPTPPRPEAGLQRDLIPVLLPTEATTTGSATTSSRSDPAPPWLSRISTVQPGSFKAARTIGERYRDGRPVIMNLTELDAVDAKRLVDFAAGLAFALRGSIDKVTSRVFLLTPAAVEISAEDASRLAGGVPSDPSTTNPKPNDVPARTPVSVTATGNTSIPRSFNRGQAGPSRIVTVRPSSFKDARYFGERYRDGQPVIMNLIELDAVDAKRLVDFAAGLAFALRGSIDKVTSRVFLLAPADVEVSVDDARRLTDRVALRPSASDLESGGDVTTDSTDESNGRWSSLPNRALNRALNLVQRRISRRAQSSPGPLSEPRAGSAGAVQPASITEPDEILQLAEAFELAR